MRRLALPAALLLAACAAPGERDPWPAGTAPSDETVGWLDERAVTYGDLARYLQTKDPLAYARTLEGLVMDRVTLAEARPLGIEVPAGQVQRETSRRIRAFEKSVRAASRAQTGEEIDPAFWLQRATGVSMADFRGWIRDHTEIELLQDRLLRYELLTSTRVEVSILVVEGEELAQDLAERLRGGADFGDLARRHSVHATAAEGGRFGFPLLEPDINEPGIRERLFKSRPGTVLGPFPARGGEASFFQLFRVESRREARPGSYADLRDDVERDLRSRPVPVGEYERWRRRILLRHGFLAARAVGEIG